MLPARIAWRNIWQHKRRSLLTSLSVAFGFWLAALFSGVANYSYTSMIDNSANMGFGHISALPTGYLDQPSMKMVVDNALQLRDGFAALPTVENAHARILGNAMIATATRSIAAQFYAYDPKTESIERNLMMNSLTEGAPLNSDDHAKAVVGVAMAEKLDLSIGKKFVVTTTDIAGEMTSQLFRVNGIYRTGVEEIDSYMVALHIASVRKMLHYSASQATMVAIELGDNRDTASVTRFIRKQQQVIENPSIVVEPWQVTQPDLASFVAMDQGSMRIFIGFVVILVALAVLNTMLMSVLERTREFGVMLALGLLPRQLVAMIVVESTVIAALGILVGTLFFLPFHIYLNDQGFDLTFIYGSEISAGGAVFDPLLRSTIFFDQMVFIVLGLFLLTIGASLYPAIKAARLEPVKSIRRAAG